MKKVSTINERRLLGRRLLLLLLLLWLLLLLLLLLLRRQTLPPASHEDLPAGKIQNKVAGQTILKPTSPTPYYSSDHVSDIISSEAFGREGSGTPPRERMLTTLIPASPASSKKIVNVKSEPKVKDERY